MAGVRQHMQNHVVRSKSPESEGNLVKFPNVRPTATTTEEDAILDLIGQAADVVRSLKDHAAATELRAHRMAQDAVEKLQAAHSRIQSVEAERQAIEAEANMRLREMEKVNAQTEARMAAAEACLSSAEIRINAAENRALEAETALKRIKDAIRSQLLEQGWEGHEKSAA